MALLKDGPNNDYNINIDDATPVMKKVFYGWWVVLACSLISFYVAGAIFFGFTAFFDPIAEEFAWSYTQISFAVSLRGLEMGIFAPFVGFLVDRFGPRKVLFWGTIMVGIGLISLSFTQSLTMFYGSILLLAFGAGGCTSVVTMTAVVNWFHKKAGIALGVAGSGIGAGGLMVLLIVYLIDLYQWRTTLIILGLGHGGSMVLRGSILREYFGRNSFGKMIGIIMGSASLGVFSARPWRAGLMIPGEAINTSGMFFGAPYHRVHVNLKDGTGYSRKYEKIVVLSYVIA